MSAPNSTTSATATSWNYSTYDRTLLVYDHHVLGSGMRLQGRIQIRLDESWRSMLSPDEQREALGVAGDMNRALEYEY